MGSLPGWTKEGAVSDTPRTDTEVERLCRLRYHEAPQFNPQVGADFARSLEREINRLHRELEAWEDAAKMGEGEAPKEPLTDPVITDMCLICRRPVPDYKPEMCCDGRECACMGMPTEPCVCSDECAKAVYSGSGGTMEDRRIAAGIKIYTP